jgi:hypothetical protein
VRLAPAGSSVSVGNSNLWKTQIHIDQRGSSRPVLALGGKKRYEVTVELKKGWDGGLETARWRDFATSLSDDWPGRCDVYRKWVLNEHGWYSAGPWNLPLYSFVDISLADFGSISPRRFLPCLSTDRQGNSLGIVAEFRCGAGQPWKPWRGTLWVSSQECAIRLGGDALPADYFQSAAQGEVSVRVTAVVEADSHVSVEVPGNPRLARKVVDYSNRAAWRTVHASSIFMNAQGTGQPAECDDSDLLRQLATQRAWDISLGVDSQLTLAWVDPSWQVGDILERIDGRPFEFASNAARHPHVIGVRHEFGTSQKTILYARG